MPGRAAYMDGRRGSSSMRLNFAGVPEQEIREGIRRIGGAMREQLGPAGLAHRLARRRQARAPRRSRAARTASRASAAGGRGRAAPPRGRPAAHAAAGTDERRAAGRGPARAGARWSAAVSLRSGRAGAGRARAARARGGRDRRRRPSSSRELIERAPTWRSSPCTGATARTGRSRGCSRRWRSPTRARGRRPACGPPTRCWRSS